ncbi:MAG: hypothetical protein RR313_00210 [Anaerovoracaceae bacterium]
MKKIGKLITQYINLRQEIVLTAKARGYLKRELVDEFIRYNVTEGETRSILEGFSDSPSVR